MTDTITVKSMLFGHAPLEVSRTWETEGQSPQHLRYRRPGWHMSPEDTLEFLKGRKVTEVAGWVDNISASPEAMHAVLEAHPNKSIVLSAFDARESLTLESLVLLVNSKYLKNDRTLIYEAAVKHGLEGLDRVTQDSVGDLPKDLQLTALKKEFTLHGFEQGYRRAVNMFDMDPVATVDLLEQQANFENKYKVHLASIDWAGDRDHVFIPGRLGDYRNMTMKAAQEKYRYKVLRKVEELPGSARGNKNLLGFLKDFSLSAYSDDYREANEDLCVPSWVLEAVTAEDGTRVAEPLAFRNFLTTWSGFHPLDVEDYRLFKPYIETCENGGMLGRIVSDLTWAPEVAPLIAEEFLHPDAEHDVYEVEYDNPQHALHLLVEDYLNQGEPHGVQGLTIRLDHVFHSFTPEDEHEWNNGEGEAAETFRTLLEPLYRKREHLVGALLPVLDSYDLAGHNSITARRIYDTIIEEFLETGDANRMLNEHLHDGEVGYEFREHVGARLQQGYQYNCTTADKARLALYALAYWELDHVMHIVSEHPEEILQYIIDGDPPGNLPSMLDAMFAHYPEFTFQFLEAANQAGRLDEWVPQIHSSFLAHSKILDSGWVPVGKVALTHPGAEAVAEAVRDRFGDTSEAWLITADLLPAWDGGLADLLDTVEASLS